MSGRKKALTIETIIFIGTHKSGSSRDAIRAARLMGYTTCLLTNVEKHLIQRSEYPDVQFMYYCELDDSEVIIKKIDELKLKNSFQIRAIVSFIDPYCALASKLSKHFGLKEFSTEAMFGVQSKLLSRKILKSSPYLPKYTHVSLTNRKQLYEIEKKLPKELPVVIKYTESNASKDVYRCNTMDDFKRYLTQIKDKYREGTVLIEELIEGPQYLIEAIVMDGELHIIAIIEQEITEVNNHFIITGYSLVLDYTEDFYNQLNETLESILKDNHYVNGPCHFEMRKTSNGWKLIEINPRISGAGMNQFIKYGLGINLVKETLNFVLDKPVNLTPSFKRHTFSEYLVVETPGRLLRVTGRNKAARSTGVKVVYVKPRNGAKLVSPTSMGHRYAYVIANGRTKEEAKQNAKLAASQIYFHILPE